MADKWGAIRVGKALIITPEQRRSWDNLQAKARKNKKYRQTIDESLHKAITDAVSKFITEHIPITVQETEEGQVHSLDLTILPTKRYENLKKRVQ